MKFSATSSLNNNKAKTPLYDTEVKVAIPRALGGDDVGTSPLKIMCSAVASCVLLMVANQLDEQDSEGMQVCVSAMKARVKKGETTYLTNWKIDVTLITPLTDDIIDSVERGMSECPAEQLLIRAGEKPTLAIYGIEGLRA